MKVVIQRVKNAKVEVNKSVVGEIDNGLLILLGIANGDTKENADYLVKKIGKLRIFRDGKEKMNSSVKDINGKVLIVSQFTLYANCNKGNRPSFFESANPQVAEELYEYFCSKFKESGIETQKGIFGADMQISLLNDGPVTIILEDGEDK